VGLPHHQVLHRRHLRAGRRLQRRPRLRRHVRLGRASASPRFNAVASVLSRQCCHIMSAPSHSVSAVASVLSRQMLCRHVSGVASVLSRQCCAVTSVMSRHVSAVASVLSRQCCRVSVVASKLSRHVTQHDTTEGSVSLTRPRGVAKSPPHVTIELRVLPGLICRPRRTWGPAAARRTWSCATTSRRQGLTLVHFSAQPEPFLTQHAPHTPPDTPRHPLQTP